MKIVEIAKEDWSRFSEAAHKACFNELRPASLDRIDYALLVIENEVPMAYATIKEYDPEYAYWQYGGSFPPCRDSFKSWKAYKMVHEYTKEKYKRVSTLIENTNTVMLKFAMKIGFKIIGVRYFGGSIMLEHFKEFEE